LLKPNVSAPGFQSVNRLQVPNIMTIAFLYAGQGSQKPGMGRDFYEEYPQVRDIFDLAPRGVQIRGLCFEADAETLADTANTQPCMGAFAAAVTRLLYSEGIKPRYTAGLSLGEYSALYAAGIFDTADLLDILALRGRAMADASAGIDFKMTAILCDNNAVVEDAAAAVRGEGGAVWCCNYNCPGQIVVGGIRASVDDAADRSLKSGARRALPLNVGGPFHTPYMKPASEALSAGLKLLKIGVPAFPVIFNTTGEPLADGESVADLLIKQVMSPVLFEKSLRALHSLGADTFIEIGPGKALSGFVRKTIPSALVYSIDTVEDYKKLIETIGKAR